MNADELQAFSQSIALHPVVAIGGLMVLISIARKIDLNHKEAEMNAKNALANDSLLFRDNVGSEP